MKVVYKVPIQDQIMDAVLVAAIQYKTIDRWRLPNGGNGIRGVWV